MRENKYAETNCTFGIMDKISMHPKTGVPIIFHDQLNIISEHLQSIKIDNLKKNKQNQKYLDAILPQINALISKKKRAKLTRKILKQQQDWSDWLGADASNAFAEAPAPCTPLYMQLDAQFHTWWKSLGRSPIPDGYGVKINKVMQGHPKSPRL